MFADTLPATVNTLLLRRIVKVKMSVLLAVGVNDVLPPVQLTNVLVPLMLIALPLGRRAVAPCGRINVALVTRPFVVGTFVNASVKSPDVGAVVA